MRRDGAIDEARVNLIIRPIVGVMGSGEYCDRELAGPVGRIIAELGCHLLTGGGGGMMAEVCRAFCASPGRQGLCIGILKGQVRPGSEGCGRRLRHTSSYLNPWVEIPIHTHLPLSGEEGRQVESRNHLNVLSSDALIVLPGGAGTLSETQLRLDYGRSLILYLGDGEVGGLHADQIRAQAADVRLVRFARTPAELKEMLAAEPGLVRVRPAERSAGPPQGERG